MIVPGTLHDIVAAVAAEHGVTVAELVGKQQRGPLRAVRAEAVRRVRESGASWEEIGHVFGRHRTTVITLAKSEA